MNHNEYCRLRYRRNIDTERKRLREYARKWRAANPEKSRESSRRNDRKWKSKNPEIKKDCDRKYYLSNREKIKASAKKWALENPEKVRAAHILWRSLNVSRIRRTRSELQKRYARENQDFVIRRNLRTRMYRALKGITKSGRMHELMGCTIEHLKLYLESKFDTGMSWESYGKVWEIDHIMPCAIFDLSRVEHQRRCFHFSNLQPLFISDNRRKKDKVLTNQYPLL